MSAPSVTVAEAERRADECLAFLRALVECESPTGDETGNLGVARLLERAILDAGGRVERIQAPGLGVHLMGRFRGTSADEAPILVMGHMDTVHPAGTLRRLPFAVSGRKVRGPGIYDMKSGLAVSICALRLLAERGSGPRSRLSFLVTCDEETGSAHSRRRIEEEARRHRAALVLEPSAPGGAVKSRRKGVGAYVLKARGRAAHAGLEPETGASAILELARQVCRIHDFADPDAGTTVTVGVIEGGTRKNVVPDSASCTIDVRFFSGAEARRVDTLLRTAAPFDKRCTLHLEGGPNRGAMEKTKASGRLLERARSLAVELGFEIGEESTGGASDGNLIAAAGCPTLDGLGPDGGGAHTRHEHIFRDDVPRRIALMAALFETL